MKKILIILSLLTTLSLFGETIKSSSIGPIYFPEPAYGENETAPDTDNEGYSKVYPTYEERYVMWILNRSRIAPSQLENNDYQHPQFDHCTNWGVCFDPVRPLNYNLDLSRASRYHSYDMGTNGCFQHASCDGTETFTRINQFYTGYTAAGENIGAGSSYTDAIHGLINEHNNVDDTHPDGHRQNIFSPSFNEVGIGYLEISGEYGKYFTQDFGGGRANVTTETVTAAIHYPKKSTLTSDFTFSAIYFDETGVLPEKANLIIGYTESGLIKDVQTYPLEETNFKPADGKVDWYAAEYAKTMKMKQAGCHFYRFEFTKSDGTVVKYPDTGSLLVGAAADCEDARGDWQIFTTEEISVVKPPKGDDGGCSYGSNSDNYSIYFLLFILSIFILRNRKERRDN